MTPDWEAYIERLVDKRTDERVKERAQTASCTSLVGGPAQGATQPPLADATTNATQTFVSCLPST